MTNITEEGENQFKLKITKEYNIELTPEQVKEAVTEYLAKRGYKDLDRVYFKVVAEYDPADWKGEYGPDYVFGGADCTGKITD